ncbi:Dynein light chain-related [Carpediemonas membranifera]|uniref:Dynein light chain roadblock n=1 Tax=Carpediemonas membranifera TaxID=201153 RepID=A0A8J6B6I6_9EUKA|nr:Dynein light chain-related [Carpediemonas membranifera]|eukprot:KAG9393857.1 Dynein light chain-related [Carpediemonas membranifera]
MRSDNSWPSFLIMSGEKQATNEVEATLSRISAQPGVLGVVILSNDGDVVRTTFEDQELSSKYATLVSQFTSMSRASVRDIDPTNDLRFVRIRSQKHEIIAIPEAGYQFIAVQAMNDQ